MWIIIETICTLAMYYLYTQSVPWLDDQTKTIDSKNDSRSTWPKISRSKFAFEESYSSVKVHPQILFLLNFSEVYGDNKLKLKTFTKVSVINKTVLRTNHFKILFNTGKHLKAVLKTTAIIFRGNLFSNYELIIFYTKNIYFRIR